MSDNYHPPRSLTDLLEEEEETKKKNDIKQIMKEPLIENGIYYVHDSDDMLKGYALIVGPSDTPYFGGYYLFEFKFPTDYPFSPPKVTYYTTGNNIRFNPNLYKCNIERINFVFVSILHCINLLYKFKGINFAFEHIVIVF
jgi:ubiquitin-protein ligase